MDHPQSQQQPFCRVQAPVRPTKERSAPLGLAKPVPAPPGSMAATTAGGAASVPSTLDLDTYLSNYTGVTRIKRLAFIASVSPTHRADALRMAVSEVKRTTNTGLLHELVSLSGAGDEAIPRDDAWIEQVDRKASQKLDKLEADLNNHKTSLVKESIRVRAARLSVRHPRGAHWCAPRGVPVCPLARSLQMGHNDLGDFHYDRGDFNTALKCYVRTRDYCTTSKHIITMCLNVIRASIQMGNFTHVANYITKAESNPDASADPALLSQLRIASGLAQLESKKYKLAARKFLEVSAEHGSGYTEVASAQDIALYGGLCALASFDRAELRTKVIESSSFRAFLELYPHVREAVHDFFHSRYASCLASLEKLKPDILLDIHLHDHVQQLYADVRSKALVQYFSPFVTVDMRLMVRAALEPPRRLLHSPLADAARGNRADVCLDRGGPCVCDVAGIRL